MVPPHIWQPFLSTHSPPTSRSDVLGNSGTRLLPIPFPVPAAAMQSPHFHWPSIPCNKPKTPSEDCLHAEFLRQPTRPTAIVPAPSAAHTAHIGSLSFCSLSYSSPSYGCPHGPFSLGRTLSNFTLALSLCFKQFYSPLPLHRLYPLPGALI